VQNLYRSRIRCSVCAFILNSVKKIQSEKGKLIKLVNLVNKYEYSFQKLLQNGLQRYT